MHFSKPGKFMLSDVAALDFFKALSIQFGNAVSTARQWYEKYLTGEDVSWSELARRGWIRESAGRIWVTAAALRELAEHQMPALAQLHQERFHETYVIAADARGRAELAEVIAALESGDAAPIDVGCQTPSWVSARLWDAVTEAATQHNLYQWLSKWEALGSPDMTPSKVWSGENATCFINLALAAIETQLPADGWRLLREELIARRPSFASDFLPMPADPPRQLQWADRLQVLDHLSSPDGYTLTLVGFLLRQVDIAEYVPVPYTVADRLFMLALERPTVLRRVADLCKQFPLSLADLALNPATCTLACSIIAEYSYRSTSGLFGTIDDTEGGERAFNDAVTILTYFYETERISPQDVAALFVWMFRERDLQFAARRDSIYRRLRHIVDGQRPESVQALISAFQASDDGFSLETPAYVSALGLVAETSIANVVDTQQFLEGYVDAIQRADYSLSVQYVSDDAAAVIVRLARAVPEGPPVLGKPHVLFALREPQDLNPYIEESRLARAVRTHVRVLCRALCRLEAGDRHAALSALVGTIEYGARSKEHGGVAGAFAAYYEDRFQSDRDQPIAEDLAAALGCTNGDDQARLLEVIKQIDEPYTLAQLYVRVAAELRPILEERISQLGPDEAPSVLSYTEMQLRTEALLNAGLTAAAQAYVHAEGELKTLGGRILHREQARFVNDLRLALLRKDWRKLYDARVPDDIDDIGRLQAADSLAFFQGVANLLDPAGNAELAEHTFLNLSTRFSHVPAYACNLIVARVRQFFRDDVFAIVSETYRDTARTAFTEAGQALTALSATDADRDAIEAYRGLILLGLNAPEDAVALLGPRVLFTNNLYLAAVVAVGQHRLGNNAAATQTIATIRERFGDSEILRAAQAVVGNKPHIAIRLEPEQSDERSRAIREAIYDFRQRDPEDQASIMQLALSELVTDIIRDASISLVESVHSLRENRIEADYNTVMHKLIRARVVDLGWSVFEESPGGRTSKGNPGKRDIVINSRVPTYAVIEGVVVKEPVTTKWTRDSLREHFAKIFKYSTCKMFFHVTYSEIDDYLPIIPLLQRAAQDDAPAGFTYVNSRELPDRGSSPPGFVAEYQSGMNKVSVVFLVLDVTQRRLLDSAAAGDRLNPRKRNVEKKP